MTVKLADLENKNLGLISYTRQVKASFVY